MILAIIWLLSQAFYLFKFGIITSLEAGRYIKVANHLLTTGHYPSDNFIFYSVQIALDALCIKFSLHYSFIVILQILLNGISVIFFYKLMLNITKIKNIAFLFTLLFLSMFYYHVYNVYLYTESIYFSLTVLFTYFIFSLNVFSLRNMLLVILFTALLSITRPTGLYMLPAAFMYIVLKFYNKNAWNIIITTFITSGLIFYFLLVYIMGSGGGLDFVLPYLDERIICGVPTITVPHDLNIPPSQNPLQSLLYIMTHHTDLFLTLSKRRLIAFFGLIRSHYSLIHNIYVATSFYLVYLLIILSLKRLFTELLPVALYCCVLIILFTLTVALSCDEWHNRFIFGLWPIFLIMASTFFRRKKPDLPYEY